MAHRVPGVVLLQLLSLRLLQPASSQTQLTYSTTGPLAPGNYKAPTYGCTVTVTIVGGGGGASRNGAASAAGGGGASFQVSFFSDGVTPFTVSAYGQGGTGSYIASGSNFGGGGSGGGATAIYASGTLLAVAGGGGGAACKNVSGRPAFVAHSMLLAGHDA
jgi:hypothetical protein